MKFLTIMVGKRDFRAAQDILLRSHLNAVPVSHTRREAVYQIPIDEARLPSVLQEMERRVKSFSLCSVAGSESDAMYADEDAVSSFRAVSEPPEEGGVALRGMFGFKKLDEP